MRIAKILIVSASSVFRDLMRTMLSVHADVVIAADGIRPALTRIAENADLGLVIAEEKLGDGEGIELLRYLRSLEEPKPRAILVSERPTEANAERARALGAIDFLGKPICFRDVAGAVRRLRQPWNAARAPRRRSGGRAAVLSPRSPAPDGSRGEIYWYLRDVSATGAFLETEAPIPTGSRFELAIDLEGPRAVVTAEVVRLQEPSWGLAGGVGVHFVSPERAATRVLAQHVAAARGDEY